MNKTLRRRTGVSATRRVPPGLGRKPDSHGLLKPSYLLVTLVGYPHAMENGDLHLSEENREVCRKAAARFLIHLDMATLFLEFDRNVASVSTAYSDVASAFRQNVFAIECTAALPQALASSAIHNHVWQRFRIAAGIRALTIDAEPEEETSSLEIRREEAARASACEKMRDFFASELGRNEAAIQTCQFLMESLGSPDVASASDELMRQGTVGTWAAFETLARSVFELVLNRRPEKVLVALEDPIAKHRIPSKITLEELSVSAFDLSKSLGTLISSHQDFSDLKTIKSLLHSIFDHDADLLAALSKDSLWMLSQMRHLVVHRRGIVDQRYLQATGDQREFGKQIRITPGELEQQLQCAVAAAAAIFVALNKYEL